MNELPPSPLIRLRNWLAARLPAREDMERNRWLAPIAHRFSRSELWRFTRRSVPRGVALGLFAGFIIPVGQIFLAAFLALPVRANVPLAAAVTFITNPFTVPFWLMVANQVGMFMLRIDAEAITAASAAMGQGWWGGVGWFLETAGVTALGFVVLAVVTASIGYVLASILWRIIVVRRLKRRHRAMIATRARAGQGPA